jgi:glyoxylase-like metal-dependent hydrolase (beta-lactamase superfamily II)
VGKLTIDRVVELAEMPVPARIFFPAITPEIVETAKTSLGPDLIDIETGDVILTVQSYVVRAGARTILVDSCIGNDKERPATPEMHRLGIDFLGRLAAVGVRPEDVDVVLCTHLHPDHVGWNTRLQNGEWVPTFPNARYLIGQTEFEHAQRFHEAAADNPMVADLVTMVEDSVLPVVRANQASFVADGHKLELELDHGLRLESAPGHTPGHVIVHVEAPGHHAILSADVIHHPLQLLDLELSQIGDIDPATATATRRRLVESYANSDTIILPAHFPSPTCGRFISDENGYAFAWLEGGRAPAAIA